MNIELVQIGTKIKQIIDIHELIIIPTLSVSSSFVCQEIFLNE